MSLKPEVVGNNSSEISPNYIDCDSVPSKFHK